MFIFRASRFGNCDGYAVAGFRSPILRKDAKDGRLVMVASLLELLFEVVGHVLMGRDGGLAFEDCGSELYVFGVLGFGGEGTQGFGVIGHHLVHVFLVEIISGEAVELIQFFLVVGVGSGWSGEAPGVCEGLHAGGHLRVFFDHLFGERLDCGVGGFLFCKLAEGYLVLVGLSRRREKLFVVIRDCFCFDW